MQYILNNLKPNYYNCKHTITEHLTLTCKQNIVYVCTNDYVIKV